MITKLHVKNFKCLLDVEVDLAPFTILIGPNDSGKSSLLDAIRRLGMRTAYQYPNLNMGSLLEVIWKKETTRTLFWEVHGNASGEEYHYLLELSSNSEVVNETLTQGGRPLLVVKKTPPQGTMVSFPPLPQTPAQQLGVGHTGLAIGSQLQQNEIQRISHSLASSMKYGLDPQVLSRPAQTQADSVLTATGDNLAAVIDNIVTGPDSDRRIALEKTLHDAIPTLRGISLPTIQNGNGMKALEFTLSGGSRPYVTIPATSASDGALLLTAFLALAYGNTPEILLIEEPENGLHPGLLELVINILRKISTGEVGNRPRQVLVTTHSPLLLNFVKPEEVRIFQRDAEKGTQIAPMTDVPNLQNLLKEFAVGELWYLFGEKGLFKEQPV